ncbi:M56 family metallopeptidase [Actinomadura rugatobispora]|uniref:M56 family metallopeptidase n=1 Tax=Actinomadura rugatobispora TaxID=1994 RepID=A0ABW1AF24_9ACTN|nr:M56 family metallopeptidase [Actinomadura rugatobispora]
MMVKPLLVAVGFTGLAIVLLGPVPSVLAKAAWTERGPKAALVLWQAVICTAGLSVVIAFLALAVAPLAATFRHGVHVFAVQALDGDPLRGLGTEEVAALAWALAVVGWLLGLLVRTATQNARLRRRHRGQIDLLGKRSDRHRGVYVLDHPAAVAYCLPGVRARVVITTGLIDLLDERELVAVLDHERAHARGRHHLVLLPFDALAAAIPRLPAGRLARQCAVRLVEMLADDHARSRHGGPRVAVALLRLVEHRADSGPLPAGALGATDHAVLARVRRLTEPVRPVPAWQRALAYAGALTMVAAPMALLVPCLN